MLVFLLSVVMKMGPNSFIFFLSLIWFHCVSTQLISTAMFDSLLCPSSLLIKARKQTHARSQSHFSFHEHRSLEASAKLFHPLDFCAHCFAICHLPFVFLKPFVFALLCMLSLSFVSWWTTVLFLSLASVSLSLVFLNYQRKGSLEL